MVDAMVQFNAASPSTASTNAEYSPPSTEGIDLDFTAEGSSNAHCSHDHCKQHYHHLSTQPPPLQKRWRTAPSAIPQPPSLHTSLLLPLLLLLLLVAAPLGPAPAAAATGIPSPPFPPLSAVTNAGAVNRSVGSTASTTTSGSTATTSSTSSSSGLPTKWTFLVYMLADNNLECFGILDLIEMMTGMAVEPSGCVSSACGAACAAGYVTTRRTSCGGGQVVSRCCPSAPYPDVLVLADRGVSACAFATDPASGLDYGLVTSTWTSAKEISVLPGGSLQVERDYGELDMASPDTLSAFLTRAWARFPPATTPAGTAGRKFALVFWDHGNGWKGYGVDDTCSAGAASNPAGCNQFSMASLAKGLAAGMAAPGAPASGRLDILGFDACLMAMYEVAAALAPYSRTLLASELLEPGHGWDYGALGAMTAAAGAAGGGGSLVAAATAAAASGGFAATAAAVSASEAAAAAAIWVARYKAQAVSYGTTGVTLALADLGVVSERLVPALQGLAAALVSALAANASGGAAAAGTLLRRRTGMASMGSGEQDSSVDLGSMLAELLAASDLDSASRAAVTTASAAYNASVLVYGRDDSLPRGTGLSIYFPIQAAAMDSEYGKLSTTSTAVYSAALAAATGGWYSFLSKLYNVSSGAAAGSFAFVQSAASVPYLDSGSGSYVLQGVLSSQNALSALLYYGFVDATDRYYILAGSLPATVDGTQVVGTWRRLLWGVTQSISASQTANATNSTVNASTATTATAYTGSTASPTATTATTSALMFVAEEWATSADGSAAVSVALTANVLYGGICSANRNDLAPAVLKYTYRFTSARASLQLFAQQASGAYGEVSAQAGGVIIPLMYKLPRDFSGSQTATYEYSGCLKWGYNGTVRVAAVGLASAADSLGLDLEGELLMLLQARDVSQTKTAYLVGPFSSAASADTTAGGCQCLSSWRFQNRTTSYAGCANPDDDVGGPWCPVLPGSCSQPGKARGAVNGSSPWDYCDPVRTLSGCACSAKYPTDATNTTYVYGKCYRSDARAAARGAWCTVDSSSCPSSFRAHGSSDTSYDHCETATQEGCTCRNSWTYDGVTYNGTCATGFGAAAPPEGFTPSSRWCRVRPGCATRNTLNGYRIGLCAPAVPRVTSPANATCALPTALPGGVPAYDCATWRNGPTAADRAEGLPASCPLDSNSSSYGTCAVRNCTALDLSACPAAGVPSAAQSAAALTASGWLGRACLSQLCAAAVVAGDAATCAADGARAAAAFTALNASAAAAGVMASDYSMASLATFCAATRGADCVTATLLPACPAVRLNATAAYDSAYVDDAAGAATLCRRDCLAALCNVAGTKCARAAMLESLRLSLLEAMDAKCGASSGSSGSSGSSSSAALALTKPAMLMCAELLAPAPSCAALTLLTAASGNVSLAPLPGTSPAQYAPLSNCTWRIQPSGLPYIQLSLSYFSTEPLYDSLLVEDADGVLAVLSGEVAPTTLSTDTGLLQLTFSSDGSLQRSGFAASYTATTTRVLTLPACSERQKLLSLTMRTADYANEASWALVGYRVASYSSSTSSSSNTSSSSGVTQQVMLAAGGALPAAVYSYFSSNDPTLVLTDSQYRNNRSYTTYVCVPAGLSTLYMYDSYGDGWTGGSLTVSYVRDGGSSTAPTAAAASAGYALLNGTTRGANASLPLVLFATMPASAEAYAAALARNRGDGFSVQATLRLAGETAGAAAVTQTKQLILRGALSAQLGLNVSAVTVKSVDAAAAAGRRRQLYGTADAADDDDDDVANDDADGDADVGVEQVPQDDVAVKEAKEAEEEVGTEDDTGIVEATAASSALAAARGGRLAAPGVEDAGADARDGTHAEAASDELLVHEPGVVEALIASARALGLRPLGRGDADADGGIGNEGVGVRRRRRRGRSALGLQDLLADQAAAGPGVAGLVSLQQPEFMWKPAAAAVAAAAVAAAASQAAQAKLPSDGEAAESEGGDGGASGGDGGGGVTVLFNGLVLAPDGVPVLLSKAPPGGAAADDDGAAVPRTLVSGAGVVADVGGGAGGGGSPSQRTASGIPLTAETASSSLSSRQGSGASGGGAAAAGGVRSARLLAAPGLTPALDGMASVVGAMRAAAAATTAATTASRRDGDVGGGVRKGGRTPVPRLRQLLPGLLRQGAAQLSEATAPQVVSAARSPPDDGAEGGLMANDAGSEPANSSAAPATVGSRDHIDAHSLSSLDLQSDAVRQRRRLQQSGSSPSGVDVVVSVVGFATRAEAEAAASTLQSVVRSGELQKTLADSGWTDAAPSLAADPTVLDASGNAASSGSSSGSKNWKMLALIIGGAAGGAVLAALLVGMLVYVARRRNGGSAAEGAGGKATAAAAGKSFTGVDGRWPSTAGKDGRLGSVSAGGVYGAGRAGSVTAGRLGSVSASGGYAGGGRAGSMTAGAAAAHAAASRFGSVTSAPAAASAAPSAASLASHKQGKVVPEAVMAQLYYNQRMGAAAAAARMHANATAAAQGAVAAGQMQAAAANPHPLARQQLAMAAQRSGPSVGNWMMPPPELAMPPGAFASPVMPMYDPMVAASMPGPRAGAGLSFSAVHPMMDPSMMAAMDPYGMYAADPYGMYGNPYGGMAMDPYYGMYGDPYAGMFPPAPGAAWGAGGSHPGALPGAPRQGWQ